MRETGGYLSRGLVGHHTRRTLSGEPGIVFRWNGTAGGPRTAHVIASWPVREPITNRPCAKLKRFSCAVHGLEGALDQAIAIRSKKTGLLISREPLLSNLRARFYAGPEKPD